MLTAAGCESPVETGAEASLRDTQQALVSAPDFVVSSVTGPASAMPGQQLSIIVSVCNQGTVGGSAPLEVYLSADTTITPHGPSGPSPDFFVGYASPQHLNPGQCQSLTVQGPASVPSDGAYYPGAIVDPQGSITETVETNNAKAGARMGVGYRPDFTISSVTGPASATPGQPITATLSVCNQGTQGGSAPLEVYLSADTTITPHGPSGPSPDSFVGYTSSPFLNPGQCQSLTVQGPASVPSEGPYYLGAIVDPQNSQPELIEDNNTRAGNRMGVGYKPDFIVSSVTGPASATPGQQITATVSVCNQGTQGGSAPLEVYLSADTTITPHGPSGPSPDSFVGYTSSPFLNPGQCQTLTVQGPASVPSEGPYYLGAVVDSAELPAGAHRDQQHQGRHPHRRGQQAGLHRLLGDGPCQRHARAADHRHRLRLQPGHAGRQRAPRGLPLG